MEARCVSGHNPCHIELVFSDGEKNVVGLHSGRVDISMMKAGYHCTGSRCFHAFLDEVGFDVTFEQVVNMENSTVLRAWSKDQKAALKRCAHITTRWCAPKAIIC
jgi:hypothetical protein